MLNAHRAIEFQVNVNQQNTNGDTALILAASLSCEKCVELLLAKEGTNVDLFQVKGQTALHFAAARGSPVIVNMLFSKKAKVDPQDNSGVTPIMLASDKGHSSVVEKFIYRNANLDIQDNDGMTALCYAADGSDGGHADIVQLLIDFGADPNKARGTDAATGLILASIKGNLDVVKTLAIPSNNVDLNQGGQDQTTALMFAA